MIVVMNPRHLLANRLFAIFMLYQILNKTALRVGRHNIQYVLVYIVSALEGAYNTQLYISCT
jgi:hypothetical protein